MKIYPIIVMLNQQRFSSKLTVRMAEKIQALKKWVQIELNSGPTDRVNAAKMMLMQERVADCLTSDVISYLFCSAGINEKEELSVLYNKDKVILRIFLAEAFKDGELETFSSGAIQKICQAIKVHEPENPSSGPDLFLDELILPQARKSANAPLLRPASSVTLPNDGDDDDEVLDGSCANIGLEVDELPEVQHAAAIRADNLLRADRVKLIDMISIHGLSINALLEKINLPFIDLLRLNGYDIHDGMMPNYSAESLIALFSIELSDLSFPLEYTESLHQHTIQYIEPFQFFNQSVAASSGPRIPLSRSNPYPLIEGASIAELLEKYKIDLDELMKKNNTSIEAIMLQNGIPEENFFEVAECMELLLSLQICAREETHYHSRVVT